MQKKANSHVISYDAIATFKNEIKNDKPQLLLNSSL